MDGEVIRRIEEKGSNLESPSFTIDASLETSIADMVSKILPLAGFYHMIEAFIETYSAFKYGRVFHALCAAMDALLQVNNMYLWIIPLLNIHCVFFLYFCLGISHHGWAIGTNGS